MWGRGWTATDFSRRPARSNWIKEICSKSGWDIMRGLWERYASDPRHRSTSLQTRPPPAFWRDVKFLFLISGDYVGPLTFHSACAGKNCRHDVRFSGRAFFHWGVKA